MALSCRAFSDEHGPGTFHSLGDLPKRPPKKLPVFHLHHDNDNDDDDDDNNNDDDDNNNNDDDDLVPPSSSAVPFPRSSSPPKSPRPLLPRALFHGKPLKSSLKSSSLPFFTPPHAPHMHLRARSEPSTLSASPKTVHFPEKDQALATVRVFSRSARPAALSAPAAGNGDETETESEDTSTRFPFLSLSSTFHFQIDATKSSPVPAKFSPAANVLLESLSLSLPSSPTQAAKPLLSGSVLVSNLAFEKQVAVRFTLDDWQTVSEVGAHYLDSLSFLPSTCRPSPAAFPDHSRPRKGRGWDRFAFSIRLEDYAHSLNTRTLWLAARYRVHSTYPDPGSTQYGPGGEWWDNNGGRNYRVCFTPALAAPLSRTRSVSATAPMTFPSTQPPPPTTCQEYAFGHILPSVPNKEAQPVHRHDGRPTSLRTGKLTLSNYVPPTVRTTSLTTGPLSSDEDTASPTSPAPSTPSGSPTTVPRVIISGQPATIMQPPDAPHEGVSMSSRPGYIADWDWSAQSRLRTEELFYQHISSSHTAPLPPEGKAFPNGHSLYDAFITQWCFAQGPSPKHPGYEDGGIMT